MAWFGFKVPRNCASVLFLVLLVLGEIHTEEFRDVGNVNRCEPIQIGTQGSTPSVEECKPHIQAAVQQCLHIGQEDQLKETSLGKDTSSEIEESIESEEEEEEAGSISEETLIVQSDAQQEVEEESSKEEEPEKVDQSSDTQEIIANQITDEIEQTKDDQSEEESVEESTSVESQEKEPGTQEDASSEETEAIASLEEAPASEEEKESEESKEEAKEESVEEHEVSKESDESKEVAKEESIEDTKESLESVEDTSETQTEVVKEEPKVEETTASEEESSESIEETVIEPIEEAKIKETQTKAESVESIEEDTEISEESEESEEDEEEEEEIIVIPEVRKPFKSRSHIEDIFGLDDIGTPEDLSNENLINGALKDLKKVYDTSIKPLETVYKYKDLTSRQLGDAEIFSKPMALFIGPWSAGKSSIINYLLGIERTPRSLKTGIEPTDNQFTIISYGEEYQKVSGIEMASDWSYSSVQKFGQNFLNHFRGVKLPNKLLQKVLMVDTPGIIENRKMYERGYPVNDAFQWFIDRADAIYIVFDPNKLEIGSELESLLDQLKGRETQVRFILNKADTIKKNDLMKVIGQLFWNLSPLLGSSEAPVIYAVSLMTKPFHHGAPTKFLLDQELMFLGDLKDTMDRRVENKILFARRHAVRVRNHAKMVDCYLNTYYQHKSIFSSKKKIAEQITEHPGDYSIYEGLSTLTNVSRYDLPDPGIYREFFRLNPLYDFRPLTSTCSYFRGCPLDKLDNAISYNIMDILGSYKQKCKALSIDKKPES